MCIFCSIIKGDIPCYKVYEDDKFLAFLDISQATIGHTLVVPKNHYKNIYELPEDCDIFNVVIKLSKKIKDATGALGVNILNNNERHARQTVDHYHIHIIPRYENDNFQINFPENKLSKDEFLALQEKIAK